MESDGMKSVFNQARAADPMDDRPQYGPVTEAVVSKAVGEPGGPIAAMRAVTLHPPATMAICVGYWYRCGCEVRGSGPFYGWQMCKEHETHARELREIDRLVDYANGLRMTFEQAHQQLGWPRPETP